MIRRGKEFAWGLLILRLGLGLCLLLWSFDKILSPETNAEIFSSYYFLDLNPSLIMIIGSLELAVSFLYIFGMFKTLIYCTGLIIHSIATLARFQEICSPFGHNQHVIAYLPLLCAFAALFLMRHFDTQWSLGKKQHLFARN